MVFRVAHVAVLEALVLRLRGVTGSCIADPACLEDVTRSRSEFVLFVETWGRIHTRSIQVSVLFGNVSDGSSFPCFILVHSEFDVADLFTDLLAITLELFVFVQ